MERGPHKKVMPTPFAMLKYIHTCIRVKLYAVTRHYASACSCTVGLEFPCDVGFPLQNEQHVHSSFCHISTFVIFGLVRRPLSGAGHEC